MRQMIADLSRDPEAIAPSLSTVHTLVTSDAWPARRSQGGDQRVDARACVHASALRACRALCQAESDMLQSRGPTNVTPSSVERQAPESRSQTFRVLQRRGGHKAASADGLRHERRTAKRIGYGTTGGWGREQRLQGGTAMFRTCRRSLRPGGRRAGGRLRSRSQCALRNEIRSGQRALHDRRM